MCILDISKMLMYNFHYNYIKKKYNNRARLLFTDTNNSVFGKTMENLRKRVDVRLVTNEKKLDKLTSKPTYVSSKIFNENLMAVHKVKETLTLNSQHMWVCVF